VAAQRGIQAAMSTPPDTPPAAADAGSYITARELLNSVIAQYTGRIATADAAAAEELRSTRLQYITERDRLRPQDRDLVTRILADCPPLLRRLRVAQW
jgi:hypothetical protein